MTLRARLTLGLVFLATTGIVITDVVSYTELRSFLMKPVDGSLNSAFHSLTTALPVATADGVSPETITTYEGGIIPGYCVQLRTLKDRVINSRCLPQYQQTSSPPGPKYPLRLSLPVQPSGAERGWGALLHRSGRERRRPLPGQVVDRAWATGLRAAHRNVSGRRRGNVAPAVRDRADRHGGGSRDSRRAGASGSSDSA